MKPPPFLHRHSFATTVVLAARVAAFLVGAAAVTQGLAQAPSGSAGATAPAAPPAATVASGAASPGAVSAAVGVRVVIARAAPLTVSVKLPARVTAAEEARVFARTSGIVMERRVDLGDTVKAGDLLARIAAPEADQSLERARAAVGQAVARENLARLNLDRSRPLVDQKFLSPSSLDNLAANVEVARADTAAAQAEVRRLEAVQQFQQVRAPFAGAITERGVERGDRVSGDGGDASAFLFKVARLNELRVIVDVPQSASIGLMPGAAVKLAFREFPGETFTATLRRRSGAIDAATGTMRVELALPNADLRLPAGLRGEATLDAGSQGGVRIPASAVQSRDGQSQVAIVDAQNRLRFKPVQVDRTSDRDVIIRSGIAEGARVVTGLSSLLREGALVSVLP